MASEINRLSLSLQATKDSLIKLQGKDCNRAITPPDEKQVTRTKIIPLDKLLPTEYILLKFNEIAGKSSAVTYNAPTHQYIEDYEIQQINGCKLLGVSEQRLIGLLIGLVFGVDAVHETPFGTPYTGNILIRVNLVQMET